MILGLFYYPALYYPLLACGTLHNKVGYVLGSLLSWTHFGVLVWQKIDCPKTTQVQSKRHCSEFQCSSKRYREQAECWYFKFEGFLQRLDAHSLPPKKGRPVLYVGNISWIDECGAFKVKSSVRQLRPNDASLAVLKVWASASVLFGFLCNEWLRLKTISSTVRFLKRLCRS